MKHFFQRAITNRIQILARKRELILSGKWQPYLVIQFEIWEEMSFISTTVPADITQSFSFKYGVANLHFIKDLAIQRKYKLETSYAIRTFTWYTVMGPRTLLVF